MKSRIRKHLGPLVLLSVLCASRSQAQDKGPETTPTYRNSLTVTSENDNYTLQFHDRYYTNGLMIRYSRAIMPRAGRRAYKKVWSAELGHQIFTPYDISRSYRTTLDRPYTGLLTAKGGVTTVSAKENVFRWEAMAGVIGAAARGAQVQRNYHKSLNLIEPLGWETGLGTDWALNAQAAWYQHLVKPRAVPKSFDGYFNAQAQVGTTYTRVSGGFLFRAGALQNAGESAWWDAHLGTASGKGAKRNYELFFYFEPTLTWQAYNATVQGGLFTKDQDPYTTDIQPFYYRHNFGVMFTHKHLTGQLGFTYKTKEARTMITHENYGTIALGYRF
ncbi:lipid A deacylase LpxR family protein [Paraflavisolibacter sp. H34]|uniref:lipid A deacylase LpxR family protein n=1 Tax=Huijunlia imazamoxiresistens TaxID=3127457 RepID=UPI003016BBB2